MGGAFSARCVYRMGNAIEPVNHRARCFERSLCRVCGYVLDNARNCRTFIFVPKKLGEQLTRESLKRPTFMLSNVPLLAIIGHCSASRCVRL